MRTKIFCIGFVPDAVGGSEMIADFAANLIALFPVVEVKKVGGCIAMFATAMNRNSKPAATSNRLQRFTGAFFKFSFEFAPVGLRRSRRSWKRRSGIDAKLAIVFGLGFRFELESGFRTGKNFEKQRHDRREFIRGKLAAQPLGEFLK